MRNDRPRNNEGRQPRRRRMRWLDPLGNGDKRRIDNLADASMRAVACEQKISAVATTDTEAYVVGFKSSDDPFLFNHLFPQATLAAVDCDSRGFCAAAGLLGNRIVSFTRCMYTCCASTRPAPRGARPRRRTPRRSAAPTSWRPRCRRPSSRRRSQECKSLQSGRRATGYWPPGRHATCFARLPAQFQEIYFVAYTTTRLVSWGVILAALSFVRRVDRPPSRRLPWFVRGRSVGIIFLRGACGAEDMSRSTLLLSLVAVGCYTDVQGNATALFPKDSDSSGASSWATTTGIDASAASETPAATHDPLPATPGSGDPWTMTTGEPENPLPEILHFEIEPDMLHEAGTAHALAAFNDHVTQLELKVNGIEVPAGAPSEFKWSFTATSKAKSDGIYQLELLAKDDKNQMDVATATLKVDLPETGDPRCAFEEKSDDGWFAGVVYDDDALVLAGALGAPFEATVWRLDPDNCAPQFGSPWKISQWTQMPFQGYSQAVGLAIDDDGRTAIAANIGTGPDRLSYIAVLSPKGSLEWERFGGAGHIYSGITASPEGFFLVGQHRVSKVQDPPRYDGFIEGFADDGTLLGPKTLAAPLPGDDWSDEFNMFDEHPRAITWSEALERLVVVGEREIFDKNDTKRTRAFSALYDLDLNLVEAWTSGGLDALEDALVDVARCGEELVASGWIHSGAKAPIARWLDSAGDGSMKRRVDLLDGTVYQAFACDSEGKFTVAANTPSGASTLGFRFSDDPVLFKTDFDDTDLLAAACDARGFCAVAGRHTNFAWLRVHHP
ncbi:hypothetical protein [Nannocystis pusilla]|uniref:hypothetical protein n=1 Tax=Nannocystis pusilla TaxID=889268 RepID=UPI003BF262B3